MKNLVYIKPSRKANKIATNSPDLMALDIVPTLFEDTRCSATRFCISWQDQLQDIVLSSVIDELSLHWNDDDISAIHVIIYYKQKGVKCIK